MDKYPQYVVTVDYGEEEEWFAFQTMKAAEATEKGLKDSGYKSIQGVCLEVLDKCDQCGKVSNMTGYFQVPGEKEIVKMCCGTPGSCTDTYAELDWIPV